VSDITFFVQVGNTASETLALLTLKLSVFEWHGRFKERARRYYKITQEVGSLIHKEQIQMYYYRGFGKEKHFR
jgi:hypothetical protein